MIIVKLLEEKHRLYSRLKEAMASLMKAIQDGDGQTMVAMGKQRDYLMAKIDGLDRMLSESGYDKRGVRGHDPVRGWVEKLTALLKEICSIHSASLALAEVRCRDLKQEILQLKKGSKALHGYVQQKRAVPRFLDTTR